MCVAIPAQVIALKEKTAVVETDVRQVEVGRMFALEVRVGDWVLVNSGQIVGRIAPEEVDALRALWKEIAADENLASFDG